MSWIEIIADRKIRDAQDEGAFDNLEGQGKPLHLESDPRVPPEQRAAYRMMKEARLLPDWIQLDKEIRHKEEQWHERVERFAQAQEGERRRLEALRSRGIERELDRRRDVFLVEAARSLREVNQAIERLNLIVPTTTRQRMVIDIRTRMEALEARFPAGAPRPAGAPAPWEALAQEKKPPTKLEGRLPVRRRRGAFG